MSTLTRLDRLRPINLNQEKEKFFFDHQYNPQFEYSDEYEDEDFSHYGEVEFSFAETAQNILKKVTTKYGDGENYAETTQGRELSPSESEAVIDGYLAENGLLNTVEVVYSNNFVARTSVYQHTLRVRTPVQYREDGIRGMLDHEIGTHMLRRLNDEQQPWHKHRRAHELAPYLETEEGMAVLHSQLSAVDKHLWYPALSYFSVCQGATSSFAELFAELKPYMADKEKRWTLCLKTKRGQRDTSQPGAFAKNQMYLRGAVSVLRWLMEHQFAVERLYVGKIALEDLDKAWQLTQVEPLVLPTFLRDKKAYRAALLELARVNKITV